MEAPSNRGFSGVATPEQAQDRGVCEDTVIEFVRPSSLQRRPGCRKERRHRRKEQRTVSVTASTQPSVKSPKLDAGAPGAVPGPDARPEEKHAHPAEEDREENPLGSTETQVHGEPLWMRQADYCSDAARNENHPSSETAQCTNAINNSTDPLQQLLHAHTPAGTAPEHYRILPGPEVQPNRP